MQSCELAGQWSRTLALAQPSRKRKLRQTPMLALNRLQQTDVLLAGEHFVCLTRGMMRAQRLPFERSASHGLWGVHGKSILASAAQAGFIRWPASGWCA